MEIEAIEARVVLQGTDNTEYVVFRQEREREKGERERGEREREGEYIRNERIPLLSLDSRSVAEKLDHL